MEFDYFYGQGAEQFSFYRVPKRLFTSDRFWNISTEAKLLYGILLDRMSLSQKNGWMDEKNRVYIIFTIENVMEALGCGNKKACNMLNELEKKAGLIEKKRQGLGKPSLIYVKNFFSGVDDSVEGHFLKCRNDTSGCVEMTSQEVLKGHGNNTDINNTDISDTDPIHSSGNRGNEGINLRNQYYSYFVEQLEYECLKSNYPYDGDILEEILELIVDTVCTNRKMVRIASDDKPAEVVRSRFMKLNSRHISFVLDCFKENTTKIRNVRQYLLAAIYNAPLTMGSYYDALVRHDMAEGII